MATGDCLRLGCAASWPIALFWVLTAAVNSSPSVTIDRAELLFLWALTITILAAAALQVRSLLSESTP